MLVHKIIKIPHEKPEGIKFVLLHYQECMAILTKDLS
jgi:hypothetical protein